MLYSLSRSQQVSWSKPLHTGLALASILICLGAPTLVAQSNYATPYTVTTFAGSAGYSGSLDGTGYLGRFDQPFGLTVDGSGNLYVVDTYNYTIRKVTPDGGVTTLAGSPGQSGTADGTGSAARFFNPTRVAVDGSGNLYVADQANNTIRKITPDGGVTTLAGLAGTPGSTDGSGSAARFDSPYGIAVDTHGNIFVADTENNIIREITSAGVVTIAGRAGAMGTTDGTGSAARFYNPGGIAVDGSGNVYVADSGNQSVRKIVPGGGVTTLAGSPGNSGSTDGSGSSALFSNDWDLTVDGSGNVYVADTFNCLIRKVTSTGVVTTLAGDPHSFDGSDGTGSAATFDNPYGITIDKNGTLYVADTFNDTIRKLVPPATTLDLFGGVVTGTNLKHSAWYGHYLYNAYPLVYEYNLGYQYVYDAGGGGVYLYDYTSGHFWYTSASDFPFVYDFSLSAYLYYYAANTPHRHFYNYGTGMVITE